MPYCFLAIILRRVGFVVPSPFGTVGVLRDEN